MIINKDKLIIANHIYFKIIDIIDNSINQRNYHLLKKEQKKGYNKQLNIIRIILLGIILLEVNVYIMVLMSKCVPLADVW